MNRVNLAAATLAAAAVIGDEVAAVRALPSALAAYRLPPDRLATVGTWKGVHWINDSVSTTPESTAARCSSGCAPGRAAWLTWWPGGVHTSA